MKMISGRHKILMALGTAITVAVVVLSAFTAAADAAPARPANACSWRMAQAHGGSPQFSRVWVQRIRCAAGGSVLFYNRTGCVYPPRHGEFYSNGRERRASRPGSVRSNYSQVTCNRFAHGIVEDVYAFSNAGGGWFADHLFHA